MSAATLVLLYHRVTELGQDPHRLAVRPDRFARQCEVLQQRYDVVGTLDASPSGRGRVMITFDDGYADNAGDACRILSQAGLPATFFITTGWLGQPREAWWDCLAHMLLEMRTAADAIEIEIEGHGLWADLRSEEARRRAHLALFWRLRPLPPVVISSALTQIAATLGLHPDARPTHRWMSDDELRSLANTEGMSIGAHTVTHPFLAALPEAEQRTEIAASRADLERVLARPVTSFSYPFGGPDAFDQSTCRLVREAGFTQAFAAVGGLAAAPCDPFAIPRNVVGDWESDEFESWLDRWLRLPAD